MTLRKSYQIEELPWDLRMALLRFVNAKAGVGEVFVIDTLTLFGKHFAQPPAEGHPHDDATGFVLPAPAEEVAGPRNPDSIPNVDPWRGY